MLLLSLVRTALRGPSSPQPLPHPPAGYEPTYKLAVPGPMDVKFNRDWWWPLAIGSLIGYWTLTTRLRPGYWRRPRRSILLEWLIGGILGRFSIYPLHEGIHAALLWVYTGERPLMRLLPPLNGYAYALSPRWYLPRNAALTEGLAPVVVLTPGLLFAVHKVPTWALAGLGSAVAHNVAASAADMYVACLLSRRPATSYTNITTQQFTIWEVSRRR